MSVDRFIHRCRLIPAHAGKTPISCFLMLLSGAHPRACGENFFRFFQAPWQAGSSPRMRGKLTAPQTGVFHRGLIPAHAGKTGADHHIFGRGGAHPRACGENEELRVASGVDAGSSPRMRGKPWVRRYGIWHTGLIPAHAGKTSSGLCVFWGVRAHPRACGENGVHLVVSFHAEGSSPRMRGKRTVLREELATERLIPAHAGKTPRP